MNRAMQKTKRIKRIEGDVVKIPLGDGTHVYARTLQDASFAFYDARVSEELAVEWVVTRPILFYLAVMDSAVKGGRWPVIGNVPLDGTIVRPPQFIQDLHNRNSFSIYRDGIITPASREECVGLERASVWEPEFVEERLRDHYAGRPNRIVEVQKMR
jgi:hypothetical protein